MKTTATYQTNGVYNPITDSVHYAATTKEIEANWEKSITIDGKETSSITLFPVFRNGILEECEMIFKVSDDKFVVYNGMCEQNEFPHRNDFKTLKEAIAFVDTLRAIVYEKN